MNKELAELYADYKLKGDFNLEENSKIYFESYFEILKAIGMKQMSIIAHNAIIKKCKDFAEEIKCCRYMAGRHILEKQFKTFQEEIEVFNKTGKPTGLLQVEIRKAHLREYFEKHYQLVKT